MPETTQTVEVDAYEEVELTPQLKTKLLRKFRLYADTKVELDRLKERLDVLKGDLSDLREQAGAKSVGLDGFRVTLVDGGTTKKLNLKKLYALGITPTQYEACLDEKPKKSFEKVTVPGEKDDEE